MADSSLSPAREAGIYEIFNTLNGKRYIGSAKVLIQRWKEHRYGLNRGSHHCRHLQAAWSKYGADVFRFRVLVYCNPRHLLLYEQIALDALQPEYNIARVAGNTLGTKRTEESRAKIAAKALGRKWTETSKAKLAATLTGRKMSESFRKTLIGNKRAAGSKHTEEWKVANSLRNKGKKRPKDEAYRAKIAASLRGRKATPEHRANQSAAQLGKKRGPRGPWSQEVRTRMMAFIRSRPNPLRGRKRSPEVIQKMSEALRGRQLAKDHRRNISEGNRRMWADPVKRAHIIAMQKAAREKRAILK